MSQKVFDVRKLQRCNSRGDEFGELIFNNQTFATVSTRVNNCYAMLNDGKVVQIQNIIRKSKARDVRCVELLCKHFLMSTAFFKYPCSSEMIGIKKVSRLSQDIIRVQLADIQRKCMILPRSTYMVSYPLLHHV